MHKDFTGLIYIKRPNFDFLQKANGVDNNARRSTLQRSTGLLNYSCARKGATRERRL